MQRPSLLFVAGGESGVFDGDGGEPANQQEFGSALRAEERTGQIQLGGRQNIILDDGEGDVEAEAGPLELLANGHDQGSGPHLK